MNLNGALKLNLRKKITLSAAVFLAVIGSIIYFVVAPTIKDIKKMRDEIQAQKTDLENKYLKSKNLKKLSKNLNKIESQLEELDKAFINQNRALEFITTMEEIAGGEGVAQKINLLSPQNLKENQLYKKIPLQIAAEGGFEGEARYLAGLEKLSYYINISSLELTAAPNSPGQEEKTRANVNMLVTADTYWK